MISQSKQRVASQSFIKEKKNGGKYANKTGQKVFHSNRLSPLKESGTKSPYPSKLDSISRTSNNDDRSTNVHSKQEQMMTR